MLENKNVLNQKGIQEKLNTNTNTQSNAREHNVRLILAKTFKKSCHASKTRSCNMPKCDYYGKNWHIPLSCFIRKNRDNNMKKNLFFILYL